MGLVNVYTLFFSWLLMGSNFASGQTWSMQQCIDSALANNSKIKISMNAMELADLKYREVKSNLIPKINVNGDYKYMIDLPYQLMPLSIFGGPEGQFKEAQFGVPHNISGNVTLQAPLYSSQLYGAIKKTELAKQLVDIQAEKTQEDVFYEVSSMYRNGQLVLNQIVYIDSLVQNNQVLLTNIKNLKKEQLAIGTDVSKVELQLSLLSSQQANLKMNLDQILNGLKLYMGMELNANLEIEQQMALFELTDYPVNSSRDNQHLTIQSDILKAEISALNKSRYIPDVGVVGSYGVSGFGYDQEPNRFLNFYPVSFVGIKFSYPIFNGTVAHKQVLQKKLEIENIELQQELTLDARDLAIESALSKLKNSLSQVEISLLQLELSNNILKDEILMHKEGISSTNDVLRAQNELIVANQTYLTNLANCFAADLELKKTTNNILKH